MLSHTQLEEKIILNEALLHFIMSKLNGIISFDNLKEFQENYLKEFKESTKKTYKTVREVIQQIEQDLEKYSYPDDNAWIYPVSLNPDSEFWNDPAKLGEEIKNEIEIELEENELDIYYDYKTFSIIFKG